MTTPEFELINTIRLQQPAHPSIPLGIGDDGAIVKVSPRREVVVVTDMLLDGVHFRLDQIDAALAGHKALAVNLSDLAAMAARPTAAFVSLALPRSMSAATLERFWTGLQQLADESQVAIAGGDTNVWDAGLAASVTVLGEPLAGGPITRSGALAGDWLFVTGALGGSLAGRHLSFTPRLRESEQLVSHHRLGAMIDISDGLAADLHHVLRESQVGATLYAERIPLSDAALCSSGPRTPLEHALSDGEDFELLFTVRPESAERLLQEGLPGCPVSHIGMITADLGCRLRDHDGRLQELPSRGWVHGVSTG